VHPPHCYKPLTLISGTQNGCRRLDSYILQKKFMPFVPEISAEFSAPPEFSGDVLEKDFSTGWARTPTFRLQTRCSSTAPLSPYSGFSVASIMKLPGRFFSYWPQDFPAVSVFTGRDFPAVSVVNGRDFPPVSAVTGRGIFRRYLLLLARIFRP
jgi:hypothetical protein